MKSQLLFYLTVCIVSFYLTVADARETRQTIRKTLSFAQQAKARELVVDNVNGSITLKGYNGKEVQLEVVKTVTARSEQKLEQASKEVSLEIQEEGARISLYVDGPFRCNDRSTNYRGWRYYGYGVNYDFSLKVPFDIDVVLKTINDGRIKVQDFVGDFEIDNINGGIDAVAIAGSGRIYAINGAVNIEFAQNPKSDCYFGSLNGEVNITFLPELAADFRVKTFNGNVYTDFDMAYLNPRPPTKQRKQGKFIYQSDKYFGARVGSGGPEIELDCFNGDVYIAKNEVKK